MIRRLYPARLSGTVSVPDSKSAWHRALICRFLAGQPLPQELHPPQEPQPPAEASLSPVISSRRPSRKLSTASSASPVTPEMSSMWAFSTALRAPAPISPQMIRSTPRDLSPRATVSWSTSSKVTVSFSMGLISSMA